MSKRKPRTATQFAALPCRMIAAGQREVMLLTSRGSGRWIIPKGWPIKGLMPPEVAAREAYEEAGLRGRVESAQPLGMFNYAKQSLLFDVHVFLMWVDEQVEDWPEKSQRQTRWFGVREAACLVREDGLSELILRLSC